mmetsp:Transcript_18106/g.38964  ORF Transcript_18106/g.38964 Transcript_18106/m.38964 type:complete len:212 (-) Transcript_18106:1810-2445(-)
MMPGLPECVRVSSGWSQSEQRPSLPLAVVPCTAPAHLVSAYLYCAMPSGSQPPRPQSAARVAECSAQAWSVLATLTGLAPSVPTSLDAAMPCQARGARRLLQSQHCVRLMLTPLSLLGQAGRRSGGGAQMNLMHHLLSFPADCGRPPHHGPWPALKSTPAVFLLCHCLTATSDLQRHLSVQPQSPLTRRPLMPQLRLQHSKWCTSLLLPHR